MTCYGLSNNCNNEKSPRSKISYRFKLVSFAHVTSFCGSVASFLDASSWRANRDVRGRTGGDKQITSSFGGWDNHLISCSTVNITGINGFP